MTKFGRFAKLKMMQKGKALTNRFVGETIILKVEEVTPEKILSLVASRKSFSLIFRWKDDDYRMVIYHNLDRVKT